jgi:hypothetical protein
MPKKKIEPEEWISSQQAAELLTQQSGHLISPDYVRRLGNTGKLTTKAIDLRTKVYLRSDVENYTVKQRGTGEVRRMIRVRKEA